MLNPLKILLLLLLVNLGGPTATEANQSVIYDLVQYDFDQAEFSINGSLTTNGSTGSFPFVTSTDFQLLEWEVIVSTLGVDGTTLEVLDETNSSLSAPTGSFVITETEIFLEPSNILPDRFSISGSDDDGFFIGYFSPVAELLFAATPGSVGIFDDDDLPSQTFAAAGLQRTLIAIRRVPEPSAIVLCGFFFSVSLIGRRHLRSG